MAKTAKRQARDSRREIPRTEAAALVRNAKAGHHESAELALIRFCEAVELGARVPPEILVWLRRSFRRWLSDKRRSLNDILGLPPAPKGAPHDPSLPTRNRLVARRVNALLRDGNSFKAAMLQTAQEFNLSKRSVEAAMTHYRAELQSVRDDRDAKKRAIEQLFPEERAVLSQRRK